MIWSRKSTSRDEMYSSFYIWYNILTALSSLALSHYGLKTD